MKKRRRSTRIAERTGVGYSNRHDLPRLIWGYDKKDPDRIGIGTPGIVTKHIHGGFGHTDYIWWCDWLGPLTLDRSAGDAYPSRLLRARLPTHIYIRRYCSIARVFEREIYLLVVSFERVLRS